MGALTSRHVAELRLRRMMAAAYGRRAKLKKKIPEQRWPRAARMGYFLALKQVLADLRAAVDRLLVPQLPRLLSLVAAGKPENLRIDSADDLKTDLDTISGAVDDVIGPAKAKQIAAGVGQQVATFNKDELNKQFKASVGIELLHGEPYLQQHLDLFAQDNARLITSLAADHVNQVSGLVMAAARAGTPVSQLQEQISARFDVAESKAELLARDQVGKLNGELTQLRQSSVGVTEYEWSTSRDERVRTRHAELEGTSHSWDDPPVVDEKTGRRAHPGQDFQCRCTAIPKVDDILNALGLDDGDGAPPRPPAAPPPAPPPPSSPSRSMTSESTDTMPSTATVPPAFGRSSFPPGGVPFMLPETPATAGLGQPFALPPPVVPPPTQSSTLSWSKAVPEWMHSATKVVQTERTAGGINGALKLTVETPSGSRHVAAWKAAADEEGKRHAVRRGTYYQREVATHDLDRELGGVPVVPATVSREIDGKIGSLQEWVTGQPTYKIRDALEAVPVEQLAKEPSVRRTFLLDVIGANDDRHGENALWRRKPNGSYEVSAIDHGLVFPEGEPRRFVFLLPGEDFQRAMLKLDETSVSELRALSLPKVADILHEQPGITSRQVRETLARIRSLQIDPDQLARFPENKSPSNSMRRWLGRNPERRGLSADDLAEIDRLSEKPK